jgi:hypothetical protein
LSFGFQVLIFKQPPVLSDVLNALIKVEEWGSVFTYMTTMRGWNLSKPYLKDQSDELGEKLYSLIK